MLTVELGYLADVLDAAGVASDVSQAAREYKANITEAIWNHTVSPRCVDNGLRAEFSFNVAGEQRFRV